MIVGIDPGHGAGNKTLGQFDPGAVYGVETEARIALIVAGYLRDECLRRGWRTFLTRTSNSDDAPLRDRVPRMRAAQCDCIVSLHCNAHEREFAHGTETLYFASEWVAAAVQREVVEALGTRDRGAKQRDDLVILRYERPAILVELGFITNTHDRAVITHHEMQRYAARAIVAGLAQTVRL